VRGRAVLRVLHMMADAEAIRLIHAELLKSQFSPDALNAIREIVRSTGRDTNRFERDYA
jgi:hypothetical protein